MNNKTLVLVVGALLILVGLTRANLTNILPSVPQTVDVMELSEPVDPNVKKEAEEVVALVKSYSGSKNDFKRLRDLMLDLGRLVELDGENEVVKNTDEIRQANSIAGPMLRLDMKNKYKGLSKESQDVVIAAIGDDNIALSKELRPKAVEGFNALAWAYNEGSK
jgi:hypothetical protein